MLDENDFPNKRKTFSFPKLRKTVFLFSPLLTKTLRRPGTPPPPQQINPNNLDSEPGTSSAINNKDVSEGFETASEGDHSDRGTDFGDEDNNGDDEQQHYQQSGEEEEQSAPLMAAKDDSYEDALDDDQLKQQHSAHEKYLNRKIDLYDEIAIVAGKDLARGNFSKTFGDINLNASIESGQPSITVESLPSKADSGTSSDSRPHRKRCRTEEEGFDMDQTISTQLQEVVSALKQFSNNQLDVNKLYEEIMKMEDVEEGIRMAAFDHLVEREMLAKLF